MTDAGIFGVTDYSGLFLSDTRGEAAGAAVTPSETGNRCMMVETQTLMCRTAYGLPRRMSLGVDFNRLVVLVAVLEKRCGLPLGTQDIYLNAMGGIRLSEPSADLAVCAALASADTLTPVDTLTAVLGRAGLTGEVRAVGGNRGRMVVEGRERAGVGTTAGRVAVRGIIGMGIGRVMSYSMRGGLARGRKATCCSPTKPL